MSDKRYVSYYGKSGTGGESTFGTTVKNGNATPNIIQTTFNPNTVNSSPAIIQSHRFVMNYNFPGPFVAQTLSNVIVPDLTLISGRLYQFSGTLTIVIQDPATTYLSANYSLNTSARDTSIIANGGFKLETLIKESGIDSYLPDTNINMTISGSKFSLSITTTNSISTSLDILADITITSVEYNS